MREVDPFGYWENHASAIAGLGGRVRSPDPRYVFHTSYHDVPAGMARFVLRLGGALARFGELSVRLHAWKPEINSNVSLVSGARLLFDAEDGAEELLLPVRFAAQKGVRYALYGYLSEDSDLTVQALQVLIEEPENAGEALPEPPLSLLAMDRPVEETRPANALLHYGRTHVDHPVSQSCTVEHVAMLGLRSTGLRGRERAEDDDAAIARWSEVLCLAALTSYGVTEPGLQGLVVGPISASGERELARYASITRADGPPPPRNSGEFYDFLLMPGGIGAALTVRDRWEAVEHWLARLKVGGLAVLGLRYRPDSDLVSSSSMSNDEALTRNEIGQWTLRLIGNGYSAAPMAFAPVSDLVLDGQGLAGFMLIVQRW